MSASILTLCNWEHEIDLFLQLNECEDLNHTGKPHAGAVEKLALERYETFSTTRPEAARRAADAEDMAAQEQTEQQLDGKGREK